MLSIYDLIIGTAALMKGSALNNDLMMYSGGIYACIGLYFFTINCANDCYRERLYQLMHKLPCLECCIDSICCTSFENVRVCFMLKTGCVYHIFTCIYFGVLFIMHAKGDATCTFFLFACAAIVVFEFRRLCGLCSIDSSFRRSHSVLRSVAIEPTFSTQYVQPPRPQENIEYQLVCEWCDDNNKQECNHQDCSKCVCSICLSSMNGQQVLSNGKCVHIFHKECWSEYTAKSVYNKLCPVCRVAL